MPNRVASRRLFIITAWLAAITIAPVSGAQGVYTARVVGTTAQLQISNFGVLGNNFVSRTPSFEYGAGSGFEHLTHSGLWVGANAIDGSGAFVSVVTGGCDQFIGNAIASLTEYSPLGVEIRVRSSVPTSPRFDPAALSDDETVAFYDDHEAKTSAGTSEPNRPLGLRVRQITHAWAATSYKDFVIVRFVLTSLSTAPLSNLWVGLYSELASGNRNSYASWPPSGSWFRKKLLGWEPGLRLLREHFCLSPPVPSGCQFELVPPWAGVQLLSTPSPGQRVTLAAWNYAPGDPSRDEDTERYALMSSGTATDLADPALGPRDGDPVALLATGPFTLGASGDSLEVAFALVGGEDLPSLQQHARSAQALRDAGFKLELVAVEPPRAPAVLGIVPGANPTSIDRTEFVVSLPVPGSVRLELFDMAGRRVADRLLGTQASGEHRVELSGLEQLPAGIYLARITQSGRQATARLVMMR